MAMLDSVKKIIINNKNAPFWSYFWDRAANRVYRSFHTNDESPNSDKFGSSLERIVVQRIEPQSYSYINKRHLHKDAEEYRYKFDEDGEGTLVVIDEADKSPIEADDWEDEEKIEYMKVKSHSDDYNSSDRMPEERRKSGYQYMKNFNRNVTSDTRFENAYSVNIESGRSHYFFVMDKQTAQSLASAILQITTDEYGDGQSSRTISDIVRIPETYDQKELNLGIKVLRVTESQYEITEVFSGSSAEERGLVPGMLINKINDREVYNLSHIEAVSLLAGRGKDRIKLSVKPAESSPFIDVTIFKTEEDA